MLAPAHSATLVALLAVLSGVRSQRPKQPVPEASGAGGYLDIRRDGSYRYAYATGDAGRHYHTASGSPDNTVVGRFGDRDPKTGRVRETSYTAGRNGFRARGPHIARKMSLTQSKLPYNPPVSPNSPAYNPSYSTYRDPNNDPTYEFGFRSPTHNRQESGDNRGAVTGSYTYVDDVGVRHDVAYEAGAKTGFHVKTPYPDSDNIGGALFYRKPNKGGVGFRGHSAIQRGKDGSFRFTATGPDQKHTETADKNGNRRGTYTYLDPKGVQRTTEYIAGPNIGYKVINTKLSSQFSAAYPFLPPSFLIPPGDLNPESLNTAATSAGLKPTPTEDYGDADGGDSAGEESSVGDFDGDNDNDKDTDKPFQQNANKPSVPGFKPKPQQGFKPKPTPGFGFNPQPTPGFGFNPQPTQGFGFSPQPTPGFGFNQKPTNGFGSGFKPGGSGFQPNGNRPSVSGISEEGDKDDFDDGAFGNKRPTPRPTVSSPGGGDGVDGDGFEVDTPTSLFVGNVDVDYPERPSRPTSNENYGPSTPKPPSFAVFPSEVFGSSGSQERPRPSAEIEDNTPYRPPSRPSGVRPPASTASPPPLYRPPRPRPSRPSTDIDPPYPASFRPGGGGGGGGDGGDDSVFGPTSPKPSRRPPTRRPKPSGGGGGGAGSDTFDDVFGPPETGIDFSRPIVNEDLAGDDGYRPGSRPTAGTLGPDSQQLGSDRRESNCCGGSGNRRPIGAFAYDQSTAQNSFSERFFSFPPGVSIKAHVQSLDIVPYGSRQAPDDDDEDYRRTREVAGDDVGKRLDDGAREEAEARRASREEDAVRRARKAPDAAETKTEEVETAKTDEDSAQTETK